MWMCMFVLVWIYGLSDVGVSECTLMQGAQVSSADVSDLKENDTNIN